MSNSMLTLCGQIVNVFEMPGGVNKKGEEYDARDKIQIMGAVSLPNGDTRHELINLSVAIAKPFKEAVGSVIRVPVGVIPSGRNLTYFIPKGSDFEILKA